MDEAQLLALFGDDAQIAESAEMAMDNWSSTNVLPDEIEIMLASVEVDLLDPASQRAKRFKQTAKVTDLANRQAAIFAQFREPNANEESRYKVCLACEHVRSHKAATLKSKWDTLQAHCNTENFLAAVAKFQEIIVGGGGSCDRS